MHAIALLWCVEVIDFNLLLNWYLIREKHTDKSKYILKGISDTELNSKFQFRFTYRKIRETFLEKFYKKKKDKWKKHFCIHTHKMKHMCKCFVYLLRKQHFSSHINSYGETTCVWWNCFTHSSNHICVD